MDYQEKINIIVEKTNNIIIQTLKEYDVEDLENIIIELLKNHIFTSKDSINNLIKILEELKQEY